MDSDGAGSAGRGSQIDGIVIETLPSALYKVRLELSPTDVGRGRIVGKL